MYGKCVSFVVHYNRNGKCMVNVYHLLSIIIGKCKSNMVNVFHLLSIIIGTCKFEMSVIVIKCFFF